MSNYAVLNNDNIVINITVGQPVDGYYIEITTGQMCDFGSLWNGTTFIPQEKSASILLSLAKNKRDEIINGGFLYMDRKIQSADQDVQFIQTAVQNASLSTDEEWPTTFAWRCMDNTWLPMTRLEVLGMSRTHGLFVNACFTRFAEIEIYLYYGWAVDINAGWPT